MTGAKCGEWRGVCSEPLCEWVPSDGVSVGGQVIGKSETVNKPITEVSRVMMGSGLWGPRRRDLMRSHGGKSALGDLRCVVSRDGAVLVG